MNEVSKADQVGADVALSAMLSSLLSNLHSMNPNLAQAVLYCSIPRWFDREVAAGMCVEGAVCSSASDEVFQKLLALTFCSPHPTRAETWNFSRVFRNYFLTRPEVTEHWQELQARAAETFQRKLEAKGLHGDERFRDDDWELVAAEWLYHLIQVDPDVGLAALERTCAESLSIPVYQGPSWEIDFCVRLLADLEWPTEVESLDVAIRDLKRGFDHLAVGNNAKALPMVKYLAEVPGLGPAQVGELRYFAGITHLYEEGKMAPALEELETAARLIPNRAGVHAEIAAVHFLLGTTGGRLDLAEKSAREAIRVEPEQAEGHVALGRVYEKQEDWEQAIALYQKAIEVEPDDIDGYLALSEAYAVRRRVPEAVELVNKAWEISPMSECYAAIRRGNVYAGARDFERARREYETAVGLGPDQPAAYVALGGFLEQRNETSEAEAMYGKAIDLDPTVEDGYMALARLYLGREKLQKAIDTCQTSLAKGAGAKGIYIVLRDIYQQQDRLAELENVQAQIVGLDSLERYGALCAVGEAWLAKATKYRGSGDQPTWLAQAQAKFEEAIELDKNRAWAYMCLGELYVLRGEYKRLDEVERLVTTHTPWAHYDSLTRLGHACLQNHEGRTCETLLKKAVELAPYRTAGWLALSEMYAWQGRPADAAKAWEQALGIDPALRYESYIALGNAYKRIEDYGRARQEFSAAVDLEPSTGEGYFWLGSVLEAEGDAEEAVRHYQAAAEKASGLAPFALINISRLKTERQELLAAERTLRHAIEVDPDLYDAYLELARLGAMCDRQDLVTEASEQVASIAPDQVYELSSILGDAYRSARRFEDARAAFDRCRELDPDRADAYVGLGQVSMDQNQWEDAREAVTQAIELDPTAFGAYTILSRIGEAENDVEGVIAAQQRIVELEPSEWYNACLNIGQVCENADRVAMAEDQYRQAMALCPWRPDAYIYLGFLLTSQGRSEDVEEVFEKAEAEANVDYLDLGLYLENKEKPRDALKIYSIGMKHGLAHVQFDLSLASARLHDELKERDEAATALRQAIALEPERPEGYVGLMYVLAGEGRLDDAVRVCHQMAEQSLLAYNAYTSLGYLLVEKEEYEEAGKAYQQAIELAPWAMDPYVQLGNLLAFQERFDDAAQVYQQMAEQPELAYEAQLRFGDLWLRQEKYKKAEKAYHQAVQIDQQQPGAHLRLAQLYLLQDKLRKAERSIRDAMQVAPDSPDPYIPLAQLKEQEGSVEEAIELYRKIALLKPSEASAAYERIGDLLIGEERYDEALAALQQAVQKDPANAGAFFSLGTVYERQGDLEQATTMYSTAIDADATYSEAYVALGRLYARQGKKQALDSVVNQIQGLDLEPQDQYTVSLAIADMYQSVEDLEAAKASYERAMALEPERPEGYVGLMYVLATEGRLDDAVRVCHQMAEQPLLAYNAYASLGYLLVEKEEYEEAGKAYQHAIELAPWAMDLYVQLGNLLAFQERFDEAAQVYQQMAEQPELAYEAQLQLGDLWLRQEKYKKAEKAYHQAVQIDQQQPGAHLRLAQLYLQQDKLRKAERSIQDAMQVAPDSPDPYILLAQLKVQEDSVEEAIELYRKIAQLKPSEASAAYERIGDLLIYEERYDEALAALQQAVQNDPANAGAFFSLGTVYERQGDLEQATAMYSKAVDAQATYTDAYAALGRLYGRQKEMPKIASLAEQLLGQDLEPTELYDAHMIIGVSYQEAEAPEWARREFRMALDLDPSRTEAYLAIGQSYEMQGKWADARAIYGRLDEVVPAWQPDVHRKLGDLYYVEEEFSEAETEYRRVISLAPDRPEGYYGLIQLYRTQEQWPQAAETWEQITALDSLDPTEVSSANLYLADVRRRLGDTEGMRAACTRVISLVDATERPNSDLLRLKGLAFFMEGEYEKAVGPLQLCLEIDPADIKAHFYLALDLLCQGKRSEADQRVKQGLAHVKVGSEFESAIREAEVLAADPSAVAGAEEILETLKAAREATEVV